MALCRHVWVIFDLRWPEGVVCQPERVLHDLSGQRSVILCQPEDPRAGFRWTEMTSRWLERVFRWPEMAQERGICRPEMTICRPEMAL